MSGETEKQGVVERKLWRACVKSNCIEQVKQQLIHDCINNIKKLIDADKMLGTSLYMWENNLYMYVESIDYSFTPNVLVPELQSCLDTWPGEIEPRFWIEMIDVFHFNEPVSLEHWRRKTPPEKRIGKLGRLKPETIPHYIFYHYALQEERSFGGDKYEIIGLNENILFGYFELPEVVEEVLTAPKIDVKVVPENWADAKISSCFIPWDDMPDVRLRPMEEILSVW